MYKVKSSYRKACKVIDSCENIFHIEGARRYINNFFSAFSMYSGNTKSGFRQFTVDEEISKMYDRLNDRLRKKIKTFSVS